ncbi:hypothetical protein D3C80_1407830 [compost metagenome]
MYLIYDVHFVLSYLRGKAHLFGKGTDIIYRVVRSGIELKYVERAVFIKCQTGIAGATGFCFCSGSLTVDRLGQDTGTGRLPYSARTAEEVCMCQMLGFDRIFQCGRDMRLPYYRFKGLGAVFTCRN